MSDRPAVGLRYCGGCNPRYDRVAAVQQLQAALPGLTLRPAEGGLSPTVVVCGCAARCADIAGLDGPLLFLCGPEDFQQAAGQLAALQTEQKE